MLYCTWQANLTHGWGSLHKLQAAPLWGILILLCLLRLILTQGKTMWLGELVDDALLLLTYLLIYALLIPVVDLFARERSIVEAFSFYCGGPQKALHASGSFLADRLMRAFLDTLAMLDRACPALHKLQCIVVLPQTVWTEHSLACVNDDYIAVTGCEFLCTSWELNAPAYICIKFIFLACFLCSTEWLLGECCSVSLCASISASVCWSVTCSLFSLMALSVFNCAQPIIQEYYISSSSLEHIGCTSCQVDLHCEVMK